MHVFDDIAACASSLPELVLTIGSFDGFHRGHQYVLEEVIRIARERGGTSGLMTLCPHPKAFFKPESKFEILSIAAEKEALLEAAGLDAYFMLPFDEHVARMDRASFLREIVLRQCGARCLVVGHDFYFGADARGDFAYLSGVSDSLGLDVVRLPALECAEERISSTQIRRLVRLGDMERVTELLGRPYTLRGKVVQGRGLGKVLGFPTANIDPPENLLPAFGIYAARVYWGKNEVVGAVNIGVAPTVAHEGPMVEVHLLGVEAELVGQELTIALYHRLRSEKKFPDLPTLKAAIESDIVGIRDYFEERGT